MKPLAGDDGRSNAPPPAAFGPENAEEGVGDEHFRALFECARVGMVEASPTSGRFLRVNPTYCALTGYSREELLEMSFLDVSHPDDREAEAARVQRFLVAETPLTSHERRYTRKDGRIIWVQEDASPLRDAEGRVFRTVAVVQDITLRREAHEQREHAISLLRATLESTADGILVIDREGKIVSSNGRFAEMWRIPEAILAMRDDDQAISFVLNQLVDPERFLEKVRELYLHPDDESRDVLEFKDGRVFERLSRPQRIGAHPVGRVWSFRDVSERIRTQELERRRTEEILRHRSALLELAQLEGPATLRRITEVDARAIGVERVSIWLFNSERTEFVCEDLYLGNQKVHEKGFRLRVADFPRYFEAVQENRTVAADDACADPRTNEFAESYLKPLGIAAMMDVGIRVHGRVAGVVCHEHTGSPRHWTPEEQHFAASVADFVSLALEAAESRRLEKAVLEISEREQQRIGQDLHDGLGQHLTGIAFICKLLEQKLEAKRAPESADASAVLRLVNDAITQTRSLARLLYPVTLEANGLSLALRELTIHVEALFGVSCVFRIHPSVNVADNFRATHLFRIAQEAMTNAVKHGRARNISIDLRTEGAAVVLSIQDDGVGFNPSRATNGLGLHILRYRSEVIGAELDIRSARGEGTKVTCVMRALVDEPLP